MAASEEKKAAQKPAAVEEKVDDEVLVVGAGVVLKTSDRAGIIRYRGPITGEDGVWFGIEGLGGNDGKKGGSNGVKAKKRYFFAPQGRALFCQASDIKKVLKSKANYNIVDPAERIEARKLEDWNANDVARWLQKIGALECITIFLVHNVTGSTLIKLTEKDLKTKFSIKDNEARTTIITERKALLARSREANPLPNLAEDAELKTSLDEDAQASDTILAPPLTEFADGWRSRSKSSPLVKKSPRKRDSYSVPENLRGKLPSPFGRRGQPQSQPVFPPARGSFRDSRGKGLLPPPVSRFHSTPVAGVASDRQQLLADRDAARDEYNSVSPFGQMGSSPMLNSLSEQDDKDKFVQVGSMDENGADSEKGHKRSSSLTAFIESNPMKKWPAEICAKWINSLGGKTSTYGALFREKKVTGKQLETLAAEALAALGVKEPGVRKWILTQRDTLLKKAAAEKAS